MKRLRKWIGARLRPRSLRDTMVSVLTVAGIAGAIALAALLALVISPSFAELEKRATDGYRHRARFALNEFAAGSEELAREHASTSQAPTDLARTLFAAHAVDAVAYRTADRAAWDVRLRAGEEAPGAASRTAELSRALSRLDPDRLIGGASSTKFYLPTDHGLMAVGLARSVAGAGHPSGYVAVARHLTAGHLSALLGKTARIVRPPLGQADAVSASSRIIDIAVPVRGADGKPVATAAFRVSREVVLLGRRVLLLAVAGSILLLVFLLLMLRRALAAFVLAPLDRVERHMQRVQASGALLPFEDSRSRDDEFGSLGRSFNAMLNQLKDLREQNEIQSFALGRSESAVGVLHNVRNALAPLATILSHGMGARTLPDRELIDRALAELRRDDIDPTRRAKLVTFVATALDAETVARDAVRMQLEVGRDAMRQTLEIIGAQQARAHERPPRERCDVSDIVARNATIARYARSVSIEVDFPARPAPVLANRVILSQVIGNLFSNAVEAIVATGRDHGTIAVEIMPPNDGRLSVRIIDDGEGFEPSQATRLFQPGFSTRTEKSGGLGLHWCANSMAAMGGALELRSAGKGSGAVAILTLDVDPEPGLRIGELAA
ncbi:sensor histidine kinase [Sphingomonas sanguinis]|uniref:sensor histidine kinase n=1 Tax=Sphingomonas sanguinis TaxID=33051 RepID=UPI001F4D0ED5|nr:HAMP domain-containing sensor histidine kinase [Sphingomonas sanguinis]